MNTVNRAFALIKASRQVVKINPSLLSYPVLTLIAMGIWFAILAIPLYFLEKSGFVISDKSWLGVSAMILSVLSIQFITTFFLAASYSAADAALQGEQMKVKAALTEAWAARKEIALWALLSGAVSIAIHYLEERFDNFGKWIGGLFGLAWSLATIFAVPVLMRHKTRPVATVKESAQLFKKTWGENVVLSFSLGIVNLLGVAVLVVPAYLLVKAPILGLHLSTATQISSWTVIILVYLWFALYLSALETIFKAALFRYAETGDYIGPFSKEMIDGAFQPKVRNKKFLSLGFASVKK